MNLLCDVGNSDLVLCDNLESGNEVKGRFKREEIYVYISLIYNTVEQKVIQHCKAIICQQKINK